MDDEYYDTDEGSVIINFQHQHAIIQTNQLRVHSKKRDEEHDKGKQTEERRTISRRLSMAATRASRSKKYSDNDILIDTGSTCSVFKNEHMLMNIVRSKYIMRAMTNGGHQDSHHVGLFPGFFEVYYNEKSLLYILSMRDVRKHFRVTMDTEVEAAMIYLSRVPRLSFSIVPSTTSSVVLHGGVGN